ncbi:LysR family transcriptional regulator [Acidocella aminolytica]|jgi:DNA-binding transcriptional LysR family regulator|uniref:Transcriptional regulator LysR n=1 Tax=Acidocella aminolytica 101 = DSM 11237 TaxID=1120923 RepID=A0A0D6PJJ5_9PROT|nr:LysR family transcriptional regulator [Acidocella aminolytica]GAN80964.1 transcriptional regulator LysR [Acidocella aminolytica 101 = DSM 11237]GBQ37150.1 LysR family transcriptional regulator [Acidocella aminolytica 101 = DSM 11237]SHF31262.1 transcriptional regulator, LysR family [Acidocella aminolytica 101 = DSM 11237]
MLNRFDLPDLQIFATIVRHRSFKRAAIELGVTTSALSHAMRKLETKMGVRLLHRTSRTVMPTAPGALLAERLEQGFDLIGAALSSIESYRQNPSGSLRINLPQDAARLLLWPILASFSAQYPQVALTLSVEDRPVDIIAEGFDAGIRYGGTVPQDMVAVPLTHPLRWVVVGSPSFLTKHGRPENPQDLTRLPCIGVRLGNNTAYKWELGDGEHQVRLDVTGPLGVNHTETTIAAAIDGLGLAYVLERRVREELERGELEVVLPDWASTGPGFYAYFASRRQNEPGLRPLIETIRMREGL